MPLPEAWKDHIRGWPKSGEKNVYNRIWNITPAITTWEIWKERNRRIFHDKEMMINQIVNKIEVSITEVMNNHLRNTNKIEGSFTSWDAKIKRN